MADAGTRIPSIEEVKAYILDKYRVKISDQEARNLAHRKTVRLRWATPKDGGIGISRKLLFK